jgi:hypothetical protein
VVDIATRERVASTTLSGPEADLVELADKAAANLAKELCAPPKFPIYLRATQASFQTDASGSLVGGPLCDYSGTRRFSGTLSGAQPVMKIDRGSNGALTGELLASTAARWTNNQLNGCRINDDGELVPCSTTGPDATPQPDGKRDIGFFLQGQRGNNVVVDWALDDPEIGYVDAGNEECFVHAWGPLDQEVTQQEYPVSMFAGPGLKTFDFSGTTRVTSSDFNGTTTLDYDWTFHMVMQRVAGP